MKKCSQCREYLDEKDFSFHKGKLQSFCKECQNLYSKEYRKEQKKTCRKNLRDWRKYNKSDRTLTDKQKSEENFRAKIRNFSKTCSTIPHKTFGYPSKELWLLIDARVADKPYVIKYKKSLKEFNLESEIDQRKAASLDNLIIEPK